MDKRRKYEQLEQIGRGSFGVIFKVQHKQTKEILVMKVVNLAQLGERKKDEAVNEVRILMSIEHENLLHFREAFLCQAKLHIITEHCERGDLGRFIRRQLSLLPEKTILKVFCQICLGLAALHSDRVMHRDIKTTNIFLKKDFEVRVGDFGIAKRLPEKQNHLKDLIGTPCYLSPELLKDGQYNDKNDIWALGCLLYEMCKQSRPFNAKREEDLQRMIVKTKQKEIPSKYTPELKNLVHRLLLKDPVKRPNIKQILQLPIIESAITSLSQEVKEVDTQYQKLLKRYKKIKHDAIKGAGKSDAQLKRRRTMAPRTCNAKKQVKPRRRVKTRFQRRMMYMKNKDLKALDSDYQEEQVPDVRSGKGAKTRKKNVQAKDSQKPSKKNKSNADHKKRFSVYDARIKRGNKKTPYDIFEEEDEDEYAHKYETKSEDQKFPSDLLIYNAFANDDDDNSYKLPEIPDLPSKFQKKAQISSEEEQEIIPNYYDDHKKPVDDPGLLTFLADFEQEINRLQDIKNRLKRIRERKSTNDVASKVPSFGFNEPIPPKKKPVMRSAAMDSLEYLKPSEHRFKSFNFQKQRNKNTEMKGAKTPKKRSNLSSLEKKMYKNKLSSGKGKDDFKIEIFTQGKNQNKNYTDEEQKPKRKKQSNYLITEESTNHKSRSAQQEDQKSPVRVRKANARKKNYLKKNKKSVAQPKKFRTYTKLNEKKEKKPQKEKTRQSKSPKLFKNETYGFGESGNNYNIAVPYVEKKETREKEFDKDFKILADLDKKYKFLENKFAVPENQPQNRNPSPEDSYYKKMEDLGKYDFQYIEDFRRQDSKGNYNYDVPQKKREDAFGNNYNDVSGFDDIDEISQDDFDNYANDTQNSDKGDNFDDFGYDNYQRRKSARKRLRNLNMRRKEKNHGDGYSGGYYRDQSPADDIDDVKQEVNQLKVGADLIKEMLRNKIKDL